jgi:isoleucyl-tRNA synthetase
MMRRVSDVLDCWFESGSMPFAQVHYPFENRDWFENHFPGDFIVEYINQTRGWFYTLHVLASALFDRPAFLTCLAHGILLGEDGLKMSKRLRNYPDPEAMFGKYGADAMRWCLLGSPVVRGGEMPVKESAIVDAVRSAIHPLWNAWYFFTLYANADGVRASVGRVDARGLLDRYALAKAHELVATVTECMDRYDLSGASAGVESFLDALTNWYIRRSRDRFWGTSADASGSPGDRRDAFDTLATVLEVLCRATAPLLPLVTESVWRGLTGGSLGSSIHLTDWPVADRLPADPALVAQMDRVRDVCSAAHSVRKARGLRARLPLASLTVAAPDAAELLPYVDLIKQEVNVKEVRLTTVVADVADRVLTVVFKIAAPRLGPVTQRVAAAARAGDWEETADGGVRVGEAVLSPGEFEVRLRPRAEDVSRALPGDDGLVILDVDVTADLEAEGLARDVVRLVQQARRQAGLAVTDRVTVGVKGPAEVVAAVTTHRTWVAEQVLAVDVAVVDGQPSSEPGWEASRLPDGRTVWIRIEKR